ncbi:hypothetical protein B1987_20470 [Mycobacterium kansasii]|uniref:DUF4267 domain-containing protein n=1 Tax=Mycobacterium attenuatum TaxID=2341086 RepID=A0A498PSL0_9MYCO|nr:hypothetical protein [Mycobacterium attenuatum]ORB85768.1 hypothetical protein B1987_20470 [Mycobacterium kansasii]VBA35344.1 hypothetical protein LAUMK136_01045 [Mycobacterium attenuatum]VBA52220.1 hypothetical protein LAUMK41_01131 [Mycobacterium attenuatum]
MRLRRIELLRGGWGALLLTAPTLVLNQIHGMHVDRNALVITRVLGARHLVQALLSGLNPGPAALAAGVVVDTVHSMAAFGLAAMDRRRARGGVADGLVAAVWAWLGWHHLRSAPDTRRA